MTSEEQPIHDEPLSDDELIYRRLLPGWAPNSSDPRVSPDAFRPTDGDVTGLSVCRGRLCSPEHTGRGRGPTYYVAVLRVAAIRALGIDIVPKPEPDHAGHCEIPALNVATRKTTRELRVALADATHEVLGPFTRDPNTTEELAR